MAEALSNERTALRADGVYVDVHANGHVRSIVIEDKIVAGSSQLGSLIADLINRAREQAQAQVENLVREVQGDPRITKVVEQIGDAPERALPTPAAQPQPEQWDEDEDDHGHGKSSWLH
ncbi:YbaB/EbfC family nucleoid-associated protein [Nocardia sp. 2]|uniref:YbaB/EbfC family nucleoid-associated protein n=1 Tax=Nocardia acididurans TaxID=2802282 RepID=A0ABS1M1N1_9NOCA|nr:YbaB/EbfC family nucleoid-associated protein [Nocardia acididurans]